MLRLEVSASPDGRLGAHGTLGENLRVGRLRKRTRALRARTCAIVRRGLENAKEYTSLQAAFPFGASPVIEPPVPPLLEPRLPQPISRDPGRHIPFCELLHELVVHLAVARERHKPLFGLSLVFAGQPLQGRRSLSCQRFAQQLGELAVLAQLYLPPLLTHERFPGGLAGPDTFFFFESPTFFSQSG